VAQEALEELRAEGAGDAATVVTSVSCRYQQQNFEQEVPVPLDATVELVVRLFHEAHERTYGYRIEEAVVELVHLNAVAVEPRETALPALAAGADVEPYATRPVYLDAWVETPVYRRDGFGAGSVIAGPAVIEEVDSTTLVPAGYVARADGSGTLVLAASVDSAVGAPLIEAARG
jgi:N-methylhydantoinase A